jgi:hypothetical protein
LLIHAISNPTNPLVRADLKLLEPLLNLLRLLARSGVDGKVVEKYQSSMSLFEQARRAVEHSGLGTETYQHIGTEDPTKKESLEDFLQRMEKIRSGDSAEISLTPRGVSQ